MAVTVSAPPNAEATKGLRTAGRQRRAWRGHLVLGAQLFVVVGAFLAPLVWMILSSFKQDSAIVAYPPHLTFSPTVGNYVRDLVTLPFVRYGIDSLVIAGGSTIIGLIFGIPAAYAAARYRLIWPAFLTLLARMAPGILFLIPWYVFASAHGLTDNFFTLIAVHSIITVPLTIWLMISFFEAIPYEVEESAMIDGCSPFGILMRISMPLVKAGIAVSVILSFVFTWNYFLFALILSGPHTTTLPVAAFRFIGESSVDWGPLLAAATLMCVPPSVLVWLVQRWLVSGITLGSIK